MAGPLSRVSRPISTRGALDAERAHDRAADLLDGGGIERRLARAPADAVRAEETPHQRLLRGGGRTDDLRGDGLLQGNPGLAGRHLHGDGNASRSFTRRGLDVGVHLGGLHARQRGGRPGQHARARGPGVTGNVPPRTSTSTPSSARVSCDLADARGDAHARAALDAQDRVVEAQVDASPDRRAARRPRRPAP